MQHPIFGILRILRCGKGRDRKRPEVGFIDVLILWTLFFLNVTIEHSIKNDFAAA